MSKFEMKHRPKKPSQDGQLEFDLYQGIGITEVKEAVGAFKKKHPFLTDADICVEYEYDNGISGPGLMLTAAGKSYAQFQLEMQQYKRDLKKYNEWRQDNAEEIALFKVAEKKRIAKAKLERSKARLAKEMAAVEAKLEKS